ncbi:sugar ABC transporter permease [Shinella sp.]|uniref:carbohydrate ABC transporter permease n=1 Tax=Shinella sp. TaxID=1870904 RepID=UPI0029B6F224|nr:sugar ABC transporter permease [Shinella sp.]MDX3973520.1 sugar ABC transporter permease [Shinella sp.]
MDREKQKFALWLTVPVVIGLLVLLLYPTIYLLFLSFRAPSGDGPVTVDTILTVFGSAAFWGNTLTTVKFTLLSTAISFLLGFSLAYAMEVVEGGHSFFLTVFMLPMAFMPVAAALTWRTMYDPTFGILNHALSFLGIGPVLWTTSPEMALWSVVIVDVWQWTGFCFIILHAGFRSLPKDTHEAAIIDGASPLQELLTISIPMLANVFIITLIFRFMDAFKAFDSIYVLTGGGPGSATETLVTRAYKEAFQFYNPAVTAIIGVWLLIFTIACTRYAGNRIARGDVR